MLKSEQQKITKQLANIDSQMKAYDAAFATLSDHLTEALDLIEDCGKTYRLANDQVKRMLNQAIFSKIWVGTDGHVTAEFKPPFDIILDPIKDDIACYNKEKIRSAETLTDFFSRLSNRIQKFFGYGWNNDLLQ